MLNRPGGLRPEPDPKPENIGTICRVRNALPTAAIYDSFSKSSILQEATMDLFRHIAHRALLGFRTHRAPYDYRGILIAKGDWQRIPDDMKRIRGDELRVLTGPKGSSSWVEVHLVN